MFYTPALKYCLLYSKIRKNCPFQVIWGFQRKWKHIFHFPRERKHNVWYQHLTSRCQCSVITSVLQAAGRYQQAVGGCVCCVSNLGKGEVRMGICLCNTVHWFILIMSDDGVHHHIKKLPLPPSNKYIECCVLHTLREDKQTHNLTHLPASTTHA